MSWTHVTAFIDGKEIDGKEVEAGKKFDIAELDTAAAIRLGGSLQTNPWNWNDLEVQFVRVDAGLHPLALESIQPVAAISPPNATVPEFRQPGSLHSINVPFLLPVLHDLRNIPAKDEFGTQCSHLGCVANQTYKQFH